MSKRLIYADDVIDAFRNHVRGGHIILPYEYIKDIVLSLPSAQPRHYHDENLLTYAHDMGVTLEQAKKELQKVTEQPETHDKRTETHECVYQRTETHDWIPVTERLPEEDLCTGYGRQYSESVLITAHNTIDDEDIVDYGHTVDGRWFSDTTDAYIPDNWDVTAWQKLPEPYKGE